MVELCSACGLVRSRNSNIILECQWRKLFLEARLAALEPLIIVTMHGGVWGLKGVGKLRSTWTRQMS